VKPLPLRVVHLWHLLQIDFMTIQFSVEVPMSVKAMMATILQNQLTLRGVHFLTPSDCEEIVEQLIEHLRELELNLAAREIADNPEPH